MAVFDLPSEAVWTKAAWNGSVFCAITDYGEFVATSPTGEVWTVSPMVAGTWRAIAWNGTVFCAVGGAGSYRDTATSQDGVNWTLHVNALPVPLGLMDIAWNGAVFCAVDNGYPSRSVTSADGVIWSSVRILPIDSVAAVAWSGSVFCVTQSYGSAVATSPDGATWTARTLPYAMALLGITWAGGVFCAVGADWNTGTAISAISAAGASWAVYSLPNVAALRSVAWNGSTICAVGEDSLGAGITATSADGITWSTDQTIVDVYGWTWVIFAGSWFCARANNASYQQFFAMSTNGVFDYAPLPPPPSIAPFWTNLKGQSEANA